MPPNSKYRNYCFTLNNYTQDDLDRLQSLPRGAVYVIYGKEISSTGTPHLQGTICFPSPRTISSVNSIFNGNAHTEPTRDLKHSISYCSKDGDVFEIGVRPNCKGSGHRTDLDALREAINEGQTDRKKLREEFSTVCAKYPNFVTTLLLDSLPSVSVPGHPLRQWQQDIIHALRLRPSPREIIFIVDVDGNSGKSWFASYYPTFFPNQSIILSPGKKPDMVYAFIQQLHKDVRVVFFDCPRSKQKDVIQYDFLEELKNGRVFSTKYESRMVEFTPPHVVVFMNESPDYDKLSDDRYNVLTLNSGLNRLAVNPDLVSAEDLITVNLDGTPAVSMTANEYAGDPNIVN